MANNIAKYFTGIGAKRLSEVEIKPDISNQHEFNGISEFKNIFGIDKIKFRGRFIFLSDDEEKIIEDEGNLTWYDARENHETRTEYRLYYSTNDVISVASVNDLVIIGRTKPDELIVVVAPVNSTAEKQLLWLFGLAEVEKKFIVKDLSQDKEELGFAAKHIITSLGIEIEEAAPDYLEMIMTKFGEQFPVTNVFSEFARSTVKDISAIEAPDETLLKWMEKEELLFKTLERHIVTAKLKKGFGKDGADVEDFISFSLSVQNRRKSRAGYAFENQLSKIFDENKISYSRGKVTELNKKPDFIFPTIDHYHTEGFNTELLTMLGLKTSSKDRWRQVLSEAARIKKKHLITLEPAISKNQTEEMISENLQLVIPKGIFETYNVDQQKQLISLKDFLKIVKDRGAKASV